MLACKYSFVDTFYASQGDSTDLIPKPIEPVLLFRNVRDVLPVRYYEGDVFYSVVS